MKRDKLDMTKTTAAVFLILLLAAIYAFSATRGATSNGSPVIHAVRR